MWQDIFLGVINWVLVISLIPTLVSKTEKPALLSSVLIALCLFGISFTYYTLSLYLSAFPALLNGLSFAILAYQRYRLNKQSA